MAEIGLNLGLLSQGSNKGRKPRKITLSAMTVQEDAAVGTAVALVSADGTAPVSFAITADPDGKFALRGNWLLLAAALDYETATAHRVEITATNNAGWIAETFTIAVTDVVEAVAPSSIGLSATSVPENAAVGAAVATISSDGTAPVGFAITADPDEKFAISGDQLFLAEALDYETATAHQVKITATNGAGTVSETFTIAVADVAEATAPTAIALSATAVPEDGAVGAAVATLSADGTAPVAFAIADDPDGKFAIVEAELRLAGALDHETKAAHQVTIRATNAAGSVDQAFTMAVTDVAEATAPTAIALSATAVPEDAAIGAAVATLSADGTDPVAFAIADDPDGRFAIVGAELRLAAALDHETRAAHQVTIRATNVAGSIDQAFVIAVTDVVETAAPTNITLSTSSVLEGAAVGSAVATISSDGTAPVTYELVSPPTDITLNPDPISVPEDIPVGTVLAIIGADDPEATFELV